MNTSSPPVVRLEGPFALGHGRLLAMSGNITIRPLTAFQLDWPAGQSEVVFAAGRRGPWTNPGRSRIADFSGDCSRVLTRLRLVKPRPPGNRFRASCPLSCSPSVHPRPPHSQRTHHNAKQRLAAVRKTLASGGVVITPFQRGNGTRQSSEDGGSTSGPDNLNRVFSTRGSRAVAGRLRLVIDGTVHICG